MAKKIGSLAVFVSANTAALRTGLAGAKNQISGFATSVGSLGGLVSGKVAALAGALGGGLAIAGLKQVADSIDNTAKAADRLGITTQALVGLRHGAELAGVGTEEFDGALQTMVKNIGLASIGLGRARPALEALGLSGRTLAASLPDEQFKAVADAIQAIQNPTDRVRIAMQLFGETGAAMINVMAGGADAIAKTQREAAKLGLTFNRIDAAKVEAANDSLTRTLAILTGLAQTLVIQIAPYIDAAAVAFNRWATTGRSGASILVMAIREVEDKLAIFSDTITALRVGFNYFQIVAVSALQAVGVSFNFVTAAMEQHLRWLTMFLPAGYSGLAVIAENIASTSATARKMLNESLAGIKADASATIDELFAAEPLSARVAKMFTTIRAAADAEARKLLAGLSKPLEDASVDIARVNEKAREIADAQWEAGEETRKAWAEVAKDRAKHFADMRRDIEQVGEELGRLGEDFRDADKERKRLQFSPISNPGLLEVGSAQAQALRFDPVGLGLNEASQRTEQYAKEQADRLKAIEKILNKIYEYSPVLNIA